MIRALIALFPAVCLADPLLFVYFKEPANMGAFFAISNDGYHWQPLNGGKPWLPIEHSGELMRDPFLTRGPVGEFHLVWTWAWRGTSFGYAHSPDLVHWSEQQEIPLMASVPGANNRNLLGRREIQVAGDLVQHRARTPRGQPHL